MALRRVWPKIILFGDSHSQRSFEPTGGYWGALLADKFQRVCDVLPRGFSGYNTRYCKMVMSQVFAPFAANEVACVTILLGSNDSCDSASPRSQHVPIDTFSQNLVDIIAYLNSIGIAKERLILMSPPNYFHEPFVKSSLERGRPEPMKSDQKVKEYALACQKVATQQSVQFLDLYAIFSAHPSSPELFSDGLHFSSKGGQLLYEHLSPLVIDKVQQFTGQSFEELVKFPAWSEVDFTDPDKSFKPWL